MKRSNNRKTTKGRNRKQIVLGTKVKNKKGVMELRITGKEIKLPACYAKDGSLIREEMTYFKPMPKEVHLGLFLFVEPLNPKLRQHYVQGHPVQCVQVGPR